MNWELFEAEAARYERWYQTAKGHRVDQAERALLTFLLGAFQLPGCLLEIGCGTGYFTRWLQNRYWRVIGLDRSPAMLSEAQHQWTDAGKMLADAHTLPFGDATVDVVLYVTALEFLTEPGRALKEAVRAARRGIVLVLLNRWSIGGISRRWGPQRGHKLLGQAHDYSIIELRSLLTAAAGDRLRQLRWASALFPGMPSWFRLPIPLGNVLGMVVVLTAPDGARSCRAED